MLIPLTEGEKKFEFRLSVLIIESFFTEVVLLICYTEPEGQSQCRSMIYKSADYLTWTNSAI